MNTIFKCDVLEGFKKLDNDSVDLIVTSPPYNIGLSYDSWNDNLEWSAYLDWCDKWLTQCYRVLKPDGRIAINHYINLHTKNKTSEFPLMDIRNIQRDIGFNVYKLIIWDDPNMKKLCAFGSFNSASAPHIQTPFEGILISYKKDWKKLKAGKSTMESKEFINLVSGKWKIQPETKGKTIANFPVDLPKSCIQLLTYENDVVLDPFMGSGTTAIACIQTNRQYIGFEISENYYKVSLDRIKELEEKRQSSANLINNQFIVF